MENKVELPIIGLWVKKGKATSFCASVFKYRDVFENSDFIVTKSNFQKIKVNREKIDKMNLKEDIKDSIYQKLNAQARVYLIIINTLDKSILENDDEVFDVFSRAENKLNISGAVINNFELHEGEFEVQI